MARKLASSAAVARSPKTSPSKATKALEASPSKVPKKTASQHPTYEVMVTKAIEASDDRKGSSRQAILKHILANFDVGKDEKPVNTHIKLALKKAVAAGALIQVKGTGATGRFRIAAEVVAEEAMKPKKGAGEKMWLPKDPAEAAAAVKKLKGTKPKKKPKKAWEKKMWLPNDPAEAAYLVRMLKTKKPATSNKA